MSGKAIDYTGQVFGLLTALRYTGRHKGVHRVWEFQCACGNKCTKTITWVVRDIKRGRTPSCGCITNALLRQRTHPELRKNPASRQLAHPLFKTWSTMKTRCNNPHCAAWRYYGGRGVHVCPRWEHDFWAFVEDMEATWFPNMTLDRIDADGDYCPENCRWATPKEQARNRRNNVFVDGKTIAQLSEESGISYSTLIHRYRRGKRGEELLAPPANTRGKLVAK